MKTAMGNGTAALLAMQKAMDVESNNAGNVKSLAYKADTVSFADMFYSDSVGQGVNMNTPIKDFSQGGLVPTNSDYDFALDGEGFFPMEDPLDSEKTYYTRAGQFKSDVNNFLADSTGNIVLGLPPVVEGDVINARHTNSVISQIIKTAEKTTSFNSYTTDYKNTLSAFDGIGTSGNGLKSSGSLIADVDEMLYYYNSALKAYSIDPVAGTAGMKATANINVSPLTASANNMYTIVATLNGVKFQQDFNTSVENTLKLFSDKLNEFTGIKSTVNTSTGELMIESMVPGQKLAVSNVKLNENNLPFTLNQAERGSGLALSDSIRDEIKSLFTTINSDLDSTLTNNYNSLSSIDKFYIYDNLSTTEKENLATSLGESLSDLENTYSNDQNQIFNYLITSNSTAVDNYLMDKFKSKYDMAELVENRSTIMNPTSGIMDLTSLERIVLDLNVLNMNTTLYDKLVTDDTTVAAYPGIESDNGRLYLRDGDSKFLVGLLAPVTFSDKTLLKPEGDSLYTVTADGLPSGSTPPDPVYIADLSKVYGGFLEYSNVDISEQLVNLLGYQKAFEANSKSISTSDEMMKTALALKNR